jgi:chaperone BCS1
MEEIAIPKPVCSMDNMALSKDMHKIVKDVRFWLKHREWYTERDITHRRGFLLHGKPGNGKTSIIRAIAEDLDLIVHNFDLSSMDNQEFINAWQISKEDGCRIVLLEDFDTVFEGRQNICDSSDLTFDTILSAIDGIEREDGLLLFVTTNFIDKIDPALGVVDINGMSSRPGRIDKCVEIGPPDFEGRFKIALRILKDISLAEEVATLGENDSGAQIQERAISKALSLLWGDE